MPRRGARLHAAIDAVPMPASQYLRATCPTRRCRAASGCVQFLKKVLIATSVAIIVVGTAHDRDGLLFTDIPPLPNVESGTAEAPRRDAPRARPAMRRGHARAEPADAGARRAR